MPRRKSSEWLSPPDMVVCDDGMNDEAVHSVGPLSLIARSTPLRCDSPALRMSTRRRALLESCPPAPPPVGNWYRNRRGGHGVNNLWISKNAQRIRTITALLVVGARTAK